MGDFSFYNILGIFQPREILLLHYSLSSASSSVRSLLIMLPFTPFARLPLYPPAFGIIPVSFLEFCYFPPS